MRVIREHADHSAHHLAASRARAASSARLEMSHTTFTVPHMNEPPRRHDITIRVAKEAGRTPTRPRSRPRPARLRRAGTLVSSARTPPRKSSAWSASPRPTGRTRSRSRWPSSPTRSGLGTDCCHPAGKRVVAAVVRGLVERRLPQLIVAGSAGDHRVPHTPPACRSFPGWCADARFPAHLRLARP